MTLLISLFMRGGIAHIAGNMLYLWIFGDNIENTLGHLAGPHPGGGGSRAPADRAGGGSLTLNPVVIFVGLLFWFSLRGIPGVLLAVPTLAILKIVCDHVDTLAPIGEFFGPTED